MIIVNFKTYEEATGDKAVVLAKQLESVAAETGADIRVAVQAMDLAKVAGAVKIPVYAQHVDPASCGAFTGQVTAEAARAAGAQGTLLNHSEKRLPPAVLAAAIRHCHAVGLLTVACAKDPEEGASFLEFAPDLIAVEPPELIGGEVSVSTASPEVVSRAAALIGTDKLLVGAGVKNQADVKRSLELGARGVLLASGVVKAGDPGAVLRDLTKGLG